MSERHASASTSARPTTPPPAPREMPVTPEEVRILEQNRLQAKARIQQRAASTNPFNSLNANGKRPAGPVPLEQPSMGPNASLRGIPSTTRNANLDPATTRFSPSKPGASSFAADDPNAPLPRAKGLGNYIEFDLSKLQNSKGGFLVDEDEAGPAKKKTIEEVRKERERERQRLKAEMEPGIVLDPSVQPVCHLCKSPELDDQLRRVFGVRVCNRCKQKYPEKFSLLTKTEVKEDYLLTDPELRDPELLPHLLKANPHKATYSNMMLFLRCQVEDYAFGPQKWGSEEGLDAEFERREEEKARKRGKKFQQGLADLRRRTRDNVWQKRKDQEHVHTFEEVEAAGEGETKQRCTECGYEIEVEVF